MGRLVLIIDFRVKLLHLDLCGAKMEDYEIQVDRMLNKRDLNLRYIKEDFLPKYILKTRSIKFIFWSLGMCFEDQTDHWVNALRAIRTHYIIYK